MVPDMTIADQINALRAEAAQEIEAFLERHEMSAALFGEQAMGDRRFVYEVRRGRKMEPETIDALRVFMKAYRPPKPRRARGNDLAAA
jgi:hypothetical protein